MAKVAATAEIVSFCEIKDGYIEYKLKVSVEIDGETQSRKINCWSRVGWVDGWTDFSGKATDLTRGTWNEDPSDGSSWGGPRINFDHGDEVILVENDFETIEFYPFGAWKDDVDLGQVVAEKIEAAIEDATDGEFGPPDAETIFDELDEAGTLIDVEFRSGDFRGCGHVVAWKDGDGDYDYEAIADYDDILKIMSRLNVLEAPLMLAKELEE